MWPFKNPRAFDPRADLPKPMVAAVLVSVVSLAVSLGVARWSWLLLDEQLALRREFMELRNEQAQSNQQYEYWLDKLRTERAEWQEMTDAKN